MGRVIYNETRIELQVRGLPHVIWILNPPVKLCRYGFGKFITDKTIIAQPLEHGIKDIDSYSILKKRVTILKKISNFRCFVGIATDKKGLLMGTFCIN